MDDGPGSADMEEVMGMCMTQESERVEGDFGGRTARVQEGELNSRRDVRPATDGREDTGGTGQYGSGVRRPRKAFDTVPRDGGVDATVDGISGIEDG